MWGSEASPAYHVATVAWWRWGALLLIALGASAACSKDDGRFSTPATPGREVVLVGGGASLDLRASFLDSELIFWQHYDRTDVLAAFLDAEYGPR